MLSKRLPPGTKPIRVAQEKNRNREPEPSEPFFPKPKAEPEPPEPFSRNRNQNRNRPFLLNCTETKKNLFCRGTAGTENWNRPSRSTPNRNRTEPNRGLPDQYINNSPGIFSCIRAGANTGATCICTEMTSLKNLANMRKMIRKMQSSSLFVGLIF